MEHKASEDAELELDNLTNRIVDSNLKVSVLLIWSRHSRLQCTSTFRITIVVSHHTGWDTKLDDLDAVVLCFGLLLRLCPGFLSEFVR